MYITTFNLSQITRRVDFPVFELNKQSFLNDIKFLTPLEIKGLNLFQLICQNSKVLSELAYTHLGSNGKYLNGKTPAYHKNHKCERLNNDFQGLSIPEELLHAGKETEVRMWFEVNKYLLERGDLEALKMRFRLKFGCDLEEVVFANSGHIFIDNRSVQSYEEEIVKLLNIASSFAQTYEEDRILSAFGPIHYQVKKPTFVARAYNTKKVVTTISRFNSEIRYPLIKLIQQYFILKYNSKLDFTAKVLNQLGFKPCSCTSK